MAYPYPYVGPIALLNNVPIEAQFYAPNFFFISAVTLGTSTTVTTTVNHNYVVGQLCRLIIPPSNGCRQLNEQQGIVTSIPAPNQVVLNINSSANVDAFKTSSAYTQPQILALGDINNGTTNASGRTNNGTAPPGAFINISPL